ncbi:MAG: hypothetical protein AVDCRST_MAG93-670 [uncultured Chloroflexia bacterium]|uniref:Uncharacterized protein n=1 Tax=uncultured Chloroflexia bacterium TaxID=1672391 RepID=A0A6J4HKW8_9CHLR|nr:MAG: hypothetical protein AVDCRST_MAG93-670 [uncultured Chloroflexia bacterium]
MARNLFTFTTSSRGLDNPGSPHGSAKAAQTTDNCPYQLKVPTL